ncbi:beta-1,2-xylosyltransferase [Aristolochia californica]|uniref:beta-1,2-xylosyltransferase n=1 Tax=Aristolochia californica TaxID=171875 RepID=UPI0035DFE563
MRRSSRKLYAKIFFFFAFNLFFFLSVHLLLSHSDNIPSKTLPKTLQALRQNRYPFTENRSSIVLNGKPWPVLPSFLPWTQNPNLLSKSCEGYFGNGFTRVIDVVLPPEGTRYESSSTRGWFRCFHSRTLQSSICEGGGLRMDPAKIRMSKGGEMLESVIGRGEEEEMPQFEPGAFAVKVGKWSNGTRRIASEEFLDRYVPRGEISMHTMRDLIASIQAVELDNREFQCDQWVEDTTLLVTRFEYANLFHTVTDWYSAYVASRVIGLPKRPHLVFVDGHCKTPLEETWEALFSSVRYAKSFTGSVCFRHAILSPLGYETALFRGLTDSISCEGVPARVLSENPDDGKTARLSEFGEMLRAAFGLPLYRDWVTKSSMGFNVLFVRREDYLAHPRHRGKVESRLSNEEEVFLSLKNWASGYSKCKVNLVNGLFAHMSMKEQLHAIQDASVIIGAHGAGLTHVIAATPKTVVLEIISIEFRRPHFALISQWKGLEYHVINLPGSTVDPAEVIDRLSSILSNLGC